MKKTIGSGLILFSLMAGMTIAMKPAIAESINTYPPAVTPTVTPAVTPAATPIPTPAVTSTTIPAPNSDLPARNHTARATCDLAGLTHAEERDGTTVILPASYSKDKKYPALVVLPYTDSAACRFFNWVFRDRYAQNPTPYIVILPAAIASRADYSTGEAFDATVGRFETTLNADIKTLVPKYNIDVQRISLAGFSFGADLGWALAVRNPGVYHGAFLIDSYCNYRNDRNMTPLAQGNTRFFLVAGRKEAGESNHPMNAIKTLLDQYKISNVYEALPSASHSEIVGEIPGATYQTALDYILAVDTGRSPRSR
jgi:predicted esterase